MILRDLKSFWVTIRRGHLRSFQGKGHFENTLYEKTVFSERVVACGSDHGQNHSFWGCVKDWWFRKKNGRNRAIKEHNLFRSFGVFLGRFRHGSDIVCIAYMLCIVACMQNAW